LNGTFIYDIFVVHCGHNENDILTSSGNLIAMIRKPVSLLLIIIFLFLPTVCFSYPCEIHAFSPSEIVDLSDEQSTDCNNTHESDNCETTCCCAGYLHLTTFTGIHNLDFNSALLPYTPQLALPQILDRIFVPPQNIS